MLIMSCRRRAPSANRRCDELNLHMYNKRYAKTRFEAFLVSDLKMSHRRDRELSLVNDAPLGVELDSQG